MSESQKAMAKRFRVKVTDYSKVFTSDSGKRVLLDLMSTHHVISSTFSSQGSASELAFKEGQRNVVLRIMTLMKVDPDKFKTLIEESDKYAEKDFV